MKDLFAPNLIVPVKNDSEIDISTLIGGCGPAFFAWYAKCFKEINSTISAVSKLI